MLIRCASGDVLCHAAAARRRPFIDSSRCRQDSLASPGLPWPWTPSLPPAATAVIAALPAHLAPFLTFPTTCLSVKASCDWRETWIVFIITLTSAGRRSLRWEGGRGLPSTARDRMSAWP
ncbi:hypothetical protein E2C01_062296 [Portunus trituberculatus]|uniref:Uncharacterized protein n=1 Tax=Portunus trituberculatus TaxID=210409 RepID=A0A5B7HER6_PORTR|nr:hypothetical protein [Portunus trituberculatus]